MNQTTNTEDSSLLLPITREAHAIASQFSRQQPTPQKAEQVRLNTLAVCAVHNYLQMMDIPTNLTIGNSWNPIMRLFADVADLEVVGVGQLECRAIKTNQRTCYVPPEVWEDRIGYVVVQVDEQLGEATLLGFAKNVATDTLQIYQLQPLEDLLSHLSQLSAMQPVDYGQTVNLNQWLQHIFEASWQTVESVLNPVEANLALSFRKMESFSNNTSDSSQQPIRRAKLIDLGMRLAGHSVALVVELSSEPQNRTDVLLQVHPTGSQIYLPPILQLIVLDESGAVFLEAKSRQADNYIQLQFSGMTGERFRVKLALGEVSITENFVI